MSAEAMELLIDIIESLKWGIITSFAVAMVALFMAIIAWVRLSALEEPRDGD